MKFLATSFIASALFVASASAHSTIWDALIGSTDLGNGEKLYIRSPPNNNPIKDLKSTALACNVNGATAVPKTVTIAAGETLTTVWKHDNPNDDIIASSHHGPIINYLAPISGGINDAVWVKISEAGYSNGKWAVDDLIAAQGKWDVKIPATLAPGEYLLRQEIIALHEADTLYTSDNNRGAQLYPDCLQLTVTGSGTTSLPSGVAFPGEYTDTTPGIKFSLYDGSDPSTYQIPGPAVWDGVTGGSAPAPSASSVAEPAPTSTEAAPVPTSSTEAAPVPTTTSVYEPEPEPTTSVYEPEPTTSVYEPEPTTSVYEPEPEPTSSSVAAPVPTTTAAPAPVPTTSTQAAPAPVPTTSQAAPAPAPTTGAGDANACWRTYNTCLDKTQPKPDFTGCSATRDSCLSNARYFRLRRSAKIARAL